VPDSEPGLIEDDQQVREIPAQSQDHTAGHGPDIALLRVIRARIDDEDCFKLELHYRGKMRGTNKPDELRNQRRPGTVLADELNEGTSPADALRHYEYMRNWSDGKYKLTRWLTMLRREAGARLRLVVWDNTDFGIPWELFWHDMDEDAQWLGAAVQVIRWTTVHDPNRSAQFSAEVTECQSDNVLYYEDPDVVEDPLLHSICNGKESGYKAVTSMNELLQELAGTAVTYGLVYVRGHGTHDDSISNATLAGVRLAELAHLKLLALRDAGSVVFLNACNSARPVFDKSYGDELNRNFAEFFLRQHAAAVMATMAEVPVEQSARLARRLIKQARSGGVQLPEYLRVHRANYAAALPKNTIDITDADLDAILHFLYASMFVYFGHTESVFKLAGR
jgi:hypothetical protein